MERPFVVQGDCLELSNGDLDLFELHLREETNLLQAKKIIEYSANNHKRIFVYNWDNHTISIEENISKPSSRVYIKVAHKEEESAQEVLHMFESLRSGVLCKEFEYNPRIMRRTYKTPSFSTAKKMIYGLLDVAIELSPFEMPLFWQKKEGTSPAIHTLCAYHIDNSTLAMQLSIDKTRDSFVTVVSPDALEARAIMSHLDRQKTYFLKKKIF